MLALLSFNSIKMSPAISSIVTMIEMKYKNNTLYKKRYNITCNSQKNEIMYIFV